ncbi:molybdopterin converting factor subunit 1 [Tengunoibacter tsumagoiensis]|uniref:Molybdopterin synthase sulfur carrier subunit n=1 Tax=Tengunoibacter tsumagoiensis TaxID=2014871 RepID=A0A402A2D2_9CHLR|nr:molybdopterin converting factor subunit 1 [Tengunoibacter tsumagoiensis]GCE13284.1 molybdopterin synthase sulfur carrier subunit [Tengunoibacter tsumagoiensis]
MKIRIRYFASFREAVGQGEETLEVPMASTVADIRAHLLILHPQLQSIMTRSVCAVNRRYVTPETLIQDGDEIVFIPPTGGGC